MQYGRLASFENFNSFLAQLTGKLWSCKVAQISGSMRNFEVWAGAHPEGLFGCHDRPVCTPGRLHSIKAGATAYISLLTLYNTITKRQSYVPALSKWHLCNDMKQFVFLNTLNRYCIERTCFGISSSNRDRFVLQFQPKFYLLLTPNGFTTKSNKFRPSSASSQAMRFISTEAIFLRGISHNERCGS